MLACQLALPPETAVEVLSRISIPVLAIYPAGTALLGALLVGRLRREQTTDALKDALGEKETLLQELQHRVKNSLAMIVSMISLEAGRIEDPGTKTALQDVQGRIIVLSDLYGLLHPGGTTEVRLDLFLRRICGSIQAAFSPGNGSKRDVELVMHFDEFTLDPKRASAVGLILNELLTNAYKYAFPENSGGTVGVTLVRRPREIELIVTDDGPYLPEGFDFSAASGFGLQLVTMLASQLGGGFSWERKDRGTVMKIILPTE
jgi:two-component sensor histidine kinase